VQQVGDSRALLITRGGMMKLLTQDHKPDNFEEAARIKAAGGGTRFGRVDGELAMSRSFGDFQYKQVLSWNVRVNSIDFHHIVLECE
jgi:serine/threonine protein phosphatase PrpC